MNIYPKTGTLRAALFSNAAFSMLSALVMFVWPEKVGQWLGVSQPVIFKLLGAGLALFAMDLIYQATRSRIASWRALISSMADYTWVLGSLALVLIYPAVFSPFGRAIIMAVAAIVLAFGFWQLFGIAIMHRTSTKGLYRHCIRMEVAAPADEMWKVISRMGDIHQYAPVLTSSFIRDGREPGLDAVRVCTNTSGKQWAEKVIEFTPGRQLQVEFLTSEPGFPFPVKSMVGGWSVEPANKGTVVTVWWELEPTRPWLVPLLLPMLALGVDRSFPGIVNRMASKALNENAGQKHVELQTPLTRMLLELC